MGTEALFLLAVVIAILWFTIRPTEVLRSIQLGNEAKRLGARHSRQAPMGFLAGTPFELHDVSFDLGGGVHCAAQSIRAMNVVEGTHEGTPVTTWELRLKRHCASRDRTIEDFWEPTLSCASIDVPSSIPPFNISTWADVELMGPTGDRASDARFGIRCIDEEFRWALVTGPASAWLTELAGFETAEVIDGKLLIALDRLEPSELGRLRSLPLTLRQLLPATT